MTFETTYPIKTIIENVQNVLIQYSDEVINIIKNRFFLFLIMIFIFVLIVLISKKLNIFLIISFLIMTVISMNKNIINWSDNIKINGLKTAIIYDLIGNINENVEFEDMNDDLSIEDEINIYIKDNTKEIELIDEYIYEDNEIENNNINKIIEKETREEFRKVNNYVQGIAPTKKNNYTGLFKGKNLIMICAEAFNSNVVNEELFPTTYRLINNGFKFSNFYQPKCSNSTSGGEYTFMTGMIAVENDSTFRDCIENNMGFTISYKLKEEGYKTYSFHNGKAQYYGRDETHGDLMGFDRFYANDTGLSNMSGKQFLNDIELFDSAFKLMPKNEPFMAYMMSYTGHMPYLAEEDTYYIKYKDKIEKVYKDHSMPFKNYVAKNMVLEEALTNLIKNLEEKNMLNNTVICMAPDHYPYGLYNSNQWTRTKDNYVAELYNDENIDDNPTKRDKTDLILWCGSLENEDQDKVIEINKPTCTIDVTPTLLNLFGIDFDSRIYPGTDMFSLNDGLVIYQDGRFVSLEWTTKTGYEAVPQEYSSKKAKAKNAINYCLFNVKNDYYGYIMGKLGTKKKICYLMFEGGPTDNTLKVLDILDTEKVKATFFVRENTNTDYLTMINNKEHKFGISIFDENDKKNKKTYEEYVRDINNINNRLSKMLKEKPRFVHISKDAKDSFKNDTELFLNVNQYLTALNLHMVDFNVDSNDLQAPITKNDIINNVVNNINDKEHIFVLFHDKENTDITLEALKEIIPILKQKGYMFKTFETWTKVYTE